MLEIIHGNCLDVMRLLPAGCIDAVVTDPPYELGFMGKSWDSTGVAFDPATWREVLRVLKPGGHLLSFGGSRTYHRIACAIEDAGFSLKDCLMWLYFNGFPKSKQGPWGSTALKPGYEPILMARKRSKQTLAQTFAAHGTGGLNVDACRPERGNWPSNVLVDEGAAALVDAQSGHQKSGIAVRRNGVRNDNPIAFASALPAAGTPDIGYGDSGGASRFLYVTKASVAEREAGLEAAGLPIRSSGELTERKDGSAGLKSPRAGAGRTSPRRNHHTTVKPISLMRWLCRLVTPPGGIVLDPFAGSGTTGCAAALEGLRFIGIEMTDEYVELARARLAHWSAT